MKHQFCLKDRRVDLASGRVRRGNAETRLEPKAAAVLAYLVSRPGDVVSRDALLEEVWNGTIVVEDALSQAISRLRKALDDDHKNPSIIETLPKRGYRLMVRPEFFDEEPSSGFKPRRALPAIAAAAALVVVVGGAITIDTNPGGDNNPAQEYVERGREYYERFSSNDNENAIDLYRRALSIDPDNADAFAGLADAYSIKYLHWVRDSELLDEAENAARAAIAEAPRSADAHKALGLALEARREFDGARSAYKKALSIDPDHGAALLNLADVYMALGDFDRARQSYLEAYNKNLHPKHSALGAADAMALSGSLIKSAAWYRRALDQAPLDARANAGLARVLMQQGDYAGAMAQCETVVRRLDEHGYCAAAGGDAALMAEDYETAAAFYAADPAHLSKLDAYLAIRRVQVGALVDPSTDLTANVKSLLEEWRTADIIEDGGYADWSRALAYALMGKKEKSAAALEKARAYGWSGLSLDAVEPGFQILREDKRYWRLFKGATKTGISG